MSGTEHNPRGYKPYVIVHVADAVSAQIKTVGYSSCFYAVCTAKPCHTGSRYKILFGHCFKHGVGKHRLALRIVKRFAYDIRVLEQTFGVAFTYADSVGY